jgi:hypothetical protein
MTTGVWALIAFIEFGIIIFSILTIWAQDQIVDDALDTARRAVRAAFRLRDRTPTWDWPLAEDFPPTYEED